jgi:hypothetical protein
MRTTLELNEKDIEAAVRYWIESTKRAEVTSIYLSADEQFVGRMEQSVGHVVSCTVELKE